MKKKCTLMVVASLVFSSINVPVVCAQEPAGIETLPTTVLPITGVSVATDGNSVGCRNCPLAYISFRMPITEMQ